MTAVSDTGLAGARLPVHFRQVNERWLDAYRPWVYGAGFGFQIGCGLATYITTAAVYLAVVLAGLTTRPAVALVVGAAFGLVRGLAVTLTRRLHTPAALLAFHQRFVGRRPWADRAVLATLVISAVVLALEVGPGPAGAAALVVATGAVVVRRSVQSPSVASDVAEAVAAEAVATSPAPARSGAGSGSGRLSRQRR